MVLDDALSLHLKEVQLLDEVCIILVELLISVDICEESPIIEVIDGILKDGIGGLVTPEAAMEPGREWLQWLVRGIIGRGVSLNDLCVLLPLGLTMQSCNSSIVELFDETGESLCSVVEGDGEVWKASIVLFIPGWALGEAIVIVIDLLLEHCDLSLKSFHLLSVDIVPNSDGVSESIDDGPELVWGWVRSGGKDVLYRGGREGESPRVSGSEHNPCSLLSEVLRL